MVQFKTIEEIDDDFNKFMWYYCAIFEADEMSSTTVDDVVRKLITQEFEPFENPVTRTVDATFAMEHAKRFLCVSMAYRSKLWPTEDAESFWNGFVGKVADSDSTAELHYYSNTKDNILGSWGLMPFTKYTFDTGLIVASVKSKRIGIVWVADED